MEMPITKRKLHDLVSLLDGCVEPPRKLVHVEQDDNVSYRPWDRHDLLRRLSTYKVATWFDKPPLLSPVVCALNGWSNVDLDKLTCGVCGAVVIAEVGRGDEVEMVERYVQQLSVAHQASCPWRERPCNLTLYELPATSRKEWTRQVAQRVLSFLPIQLPELHDILVTKQEAQKVRDLLTDWSTANQTPLTEWEPSMTLPMVTLAATGWEAVDGVLTCAQCFRKAGIWSFTNEMGFDAVGEHRPYCAWISGDPPRWRQHLETATTQSVVSINTRDALQLVKQLLAT